MKAMESGDVEAVMGLLAEDADWSMPPLPAWFTGPDALRNFMHNGPLSGEWRWRHRPTQANGQPAVGSYAWYEPDQGYRLFAIDVFTLEGARIKSITSFINRSTLGRDDLFYQRYPEQPMDDSNQRERRGLRPARAAHRPMNSSLSEWSLPDMFKNTKAFSGFAVDDVDKAREFTPRRSASRCQRRTGN